MTNEKTHAEMAESWISTCRLTTSYGLPVSEEAHQKVERHLVMASYEDHARRGTGAR